MLTRAARESQSSLPAYLPVVLRTLGHQVSCPKDGWVFRKGDPVRAVFLVLDGEVRLSRFALDWPQLAVQRPSSRSGAIVGGRSSTRTGRAASNHDRITWSSLGVAHHAAGGGCLSTCGDSASMQAQRGADDVQIVIAGEARFGSSKVPTRTKIRWGRTSASLKSGVPHVRQNRRCI